MPNRWKVIETDNFGGDYPNESFVSPTPSLSEEEAKILAVLLNSFTGPNHPRFYRAVNSEYKLQPAFEP